MATVYIETTIPSFYFEGRSEIEMLAWRDATRRWWDERRHDYQLVTSDVVLAELERAPRVKAEAGLRLLAGVRTIERTPEAVAAAAFYLANRLVPRSAAADALHIALCSVHSIDFLLTWNCRHLANANKTRHLAVLNGRMNLPAPNITTPYSLLAEGP